MFSTECREMFSMECRESRFQWNVDLWVALKLHQLDFTTKHEYSSLTCNS